MGKSTISFETRSADEQLTGKKQLTGHLLLNAADEIIYANKQARHFLGLLVDEPLPTGHKFLSLVQSAYQCYPSFAWLDWPKRPSTTFRYLIYTSGRSAAFSLLKVEIVEHLIIDGNEIWAVTLDLVESSSDTAVIRFTHC